MLATLFRTWMCTSFSHLYTSTRVDAGKIVSCVKSCYGSRRCVHFIRRCALLASIDHFQILMLLNPLHHFAQSDWLTEHPLQTGITINRGNLSVKLLGPLRVGCSNLCSDFVSVPLTTTIISCSDARLYGLMIERQSVALVVCHDDDAVCCEKAHRISATMLNIWKLNCTLASFVSAALVHTHTHSATMFIVCAAAAAAAIASI